MFLWTHQEPRGIDQASLQAAARAKIGAWGIDAIGPSQGSRVDDFLAMVVESFVIRQEMIDGGDPTKLSNLVPAIAGKLGLVVDVGQAPDADHAAAQYTLLRTWEVFARANGWRDSSASQLTATTGHSDPNQSVQSNVIAIVAIVVGIAALAGLIAFVIWNVNAIVDHQLARQKQAKELIRQHADVQEMLKRHAAAERAAGHAIPFNDEERAMLRQLTRMQNEAMHGWQKENEPSPPGPPPTAVAERVLTLAVVLGFVYFVIRDRI